MSLRKWYFATNVHGLRWAFNQMKAAVLSAKAHTSLHPHVIIDDAGSDDLTDQRIAWLAAQGVTVIRHRASLVSELVPVFGEQMHIYSGHWLRCDIPLIEKEDNFVLYTDIDVVFEADVGPLACEPKVVACGPESKRGDTGYFNSGVMILNVQEFGSRREAMIELLRSRLDVTAPYDDQNMLNELFASDWERLDDVWNWKPYWGANERALIVHWHGPKPNHAVEMLAGDTSRFGPDYETLFKKDPYGYRYYLSKFDAYE